MKKLIFIFLFLCFSLLLVANGLAEDRYVLHIGDSLTVGPFGEEMDFYYGKTYGSSQRAIFGSCGASPESYLKAYRTYYSLCGVRANNILEEPSNRKEKNLPTPKIEDLLVKYHPKLVVVQLGTNWMDGFNFSRDAAILDKFVTTIKNAGSKIVWITPPDSSHYSKNVQIQVKKVILDGAAKYGYKVIDSSKLTHYTRKSGSDGIHYNEREGKAWAKAVISNF